MKPRYLAPLPALLDVETHFQRLLGHQQVTDAYLLAIAATNDAVLLTLDRRVVPPETARKHIEVITP